MENQDLKIQRNSNLVKGFMVIVIIAQAIKFYQTNILDFGSIAGSLAVLLFLRGLLVSPQLLISPINFWFKSNTRIPKESFKYFLLAVPLFAVSLF